jgi:hypothetical protein
VAARNFAGTTAITQDIRIISDKYDEVVKAPEAESPKLSWVLDLDQLARVERLPADTTFTNTTDEIVRAIQDSPPLPSNS